MAGWGASLTDSFDFGIGLKYIDSRITSSARTGALDVGARYRMHVYDWPYVLALNARNIGGKLTYRKQRDTLPLSYRFGFSFHDIGEILDVTRRMNALDDGRKNVHVSYDKKR